MSRSRIELAARNNACWCDLMCGAHGVPGEFLRDVWRNRHAVPPFHSNLVVIARTAGGESTMASIRGFLARPPQPGWSLKDSFASLDLAPLGFVPCFEATWLWCEIPQRHPSALPTRLEWTRVRTGADLARWEAAWWGDARHEAQARDRTQFPDSLLENPDVTFLQALRGEEVVAGAILNCSDEVVGLSNVFVHGSEPVAARTALLQAVRHNFPGRPVVCYERGDDLSTALVCGFEPVGGLIVWSSPT